MPKRFLYVTRVDVAISLHNLLRKLHEGLVVTTLADAEDHEIHT